MEVRFGGRVCLGGCKTFWDLNTLPGVKPLRVVFPLLLAISIAAPALSNSLGSGGKSLGYATAFEGTAESAPESAAAIHLSDLSPKQGQVVEVTVPASAFADAPPVLEVLGSKIKMFPNKSGDEGIYRALFAVPVVQKPGQYALSVGSMSLKFNVRNAGFVVQRLSLPPSKNNFNTSPGEEEAVDKAKKTVSPERMWSSNFVKPSKARMSAPFGIRRIVNGKLLPDYFHSGLDFAGFQGSPIYATAPGTVILAQGGNVFKLHGNMVAIDHGQGVVSFYIHMQKVLVKVGQKVEGGEQIGMVGQTGRANGPHLHFSIYCNQVASSPLQWFSKAL